MKFLILGVVAVVLSSCSFKPQTGAGGVKTVNGMSFSSMTLPNELEVLLVSDSRFKKSSAAMAVMVGSLEDPVNAEGMAHYLEHMLFLGTKEFPKHDEYSSYMETHGGWDNAYTSDEITNYMFEVDHVAIEGGLHRFSRFFVSPTFDEQFVQREKNAVNSEFEKNIKDDNWRLDRYISQLSKEDHPYRKFSTGNTKTLANVDRGAVINFYRKYYSSNNMKLVVMSAEPLEKLKEWTTKYFSDVPNFHTQKPKYDEFYFSDKDDKRLNFVKTIDDSEELHVLFNVPDEKPYWKTKPLNILSQLLGHESKGSLLSYLRDKGWALELNAGEQTWNTFGVNITLTPEGHKQYKKVISSVFFYIDMIKKQGYPQYIFEDAKALSKIDLDNLEPSASGNRAASFSKAMTVYPVDEFLERNFLLHEYSKEDFEKFLSYMDFKKAEVIVTSKKEVTDKKEDIFGVEYKKEVLSEDILSSLEKSPENLLAYPEKNKYIPTDFSLVTKTMQGPVEQADLGDSRQVYYQQDTELGIARSIIGVRFISAVENTPKNYLLNYLFTMCKEEELREWAAPIQDARVDFALSAQYADTMYFSASGYSHRLMTTIKDLVIDKANDRRLNHCALNNELFMKLKAKLKQELQNKEEDVAFQRLMEEVSYFTVDKSVHWREILPFVDKITLKDVQKFGADFFKTVAMTEIAYGNIKPDEAKSLLPFLTETLGSTALDKAAVEQRQRQFRLLPEGKEYSMVVKGRNNNYAMTTIYNVGDWNVADHAKVLLLGQMIAQPYFSELRTTQQLGYVARSGPSFNRGFVGLTAMLQSPKYPSLELQQKSQAFVGDYLKGKAVALMDEEIAPVKSALVNELLTKPNTLNERFGQFRDGLFNYDGQFDVRKRLAEEMKKLNAAQLKEFIQKRFVDTKPATLNIFYYGTGTKIPLKTLPGKVFEKTNDVKDWIYKNPYKRDLPENQGGEKSH